MHLKKSPRAKILYKIKKIYASNNKKLEKIDFFYKKSLKFITKINLVEILPKSFCYSSKIYKISKFL